ncbi:transcriptional regulator with XRE-family HTH domain [Anoxybacillus tepidamans]|uniref:Transcriptional regulator with XRE-family HTH domain n=1 Tax=Anoxybacteroides tepidamans TaxID=265948 RepID=A0A7W8MWH6_9BACL|nr:hypothetical protein [Anoxybacillus tepidamans]MBB5324660.1 transcriptional regulator with XRE-family HTH domain [Anoxybacillus tepidamans]
MSRFTSVSPYRQWDVRFGNRPHGIDTTVRTYQLTPDQLERLRNGESFDDILKGASEVVKQKLDLTVEEYVEMKLKGMNDAEIAQAKGLTKQQLYNWRSFRRTKIEQAEQAMKEAQQEIAAAVETEQGTQETVKESNVTEEIDDKGIEWLKREAIHAHKLLTEKEQECEEKQHMLDAVLARNEELHKEVLVLESEIARLKELVQELTNRNERYSDTTFENERELRALRMYALHKLQKDVYGV